MSTSYTKTKEVYLTQAQYDSRKAAGTLETGVTYKITDALDTTPTSGSSKLITSGGVYTALGSKVDSSLVGASNGVASLDSNTKIPVGQLPDAILGQLTYGGNFDSVGVATITASLKTKLSITDTTIQLINSATDDTTTTPKSYGYKTLEGAFFIATASFTIGETTFEVGDWLISIGTAWAKIDNTDAVSGVKGDAESVYRTGNVNITADNVGALPTTGGTMTGDILLSTNKAIKDVGGANLIVNEGSQVISVGGVSSILKLYTKSDRNVVHMVENNAYQMYDENNLKPNPTLSGTETTLTGISFGNTSYKIGSISYEEV